MLKNYQKILHKKSIKFRLVTLVIILIFSITSLAYFSLNGISKLTQKAHEINQKYLTEIINLFELTEHLYSVVIEGKNHILSSDAMTKIQAEERIENNIQQVDDILQNIKEEVKFEEDKYLFKSFQKEYTLYKEINNEIKAFSSIGLDSTASLISATKELYVFRNMQQILQKIMSMNIERANKSNQQAYILEKQTSLEIYIIVSFIIIILFFISFFLIKDITSSIKNLKENLSILGGGDIPYKIIQESTDEIGEMAIEVNILSENLKNIINFTKEINKGKFKSNFASLGKQDVLGNTLIALRDNLKNAKINEQKQKIIDQENNWFTKGLTKFADILRQENDDLEKLSSKIIINLVQYLNVNQGAFFIYNEEEKVLELASAFAYGRRKLLNKKIKLGQGLVGSCAMEKNKIILKEVPQDYIRITSGLGESLPKYLLLVPLKLDEQILGVIEIASFKELKNIEINFIERLADNIASTIANTRITIETNKLLEISKQQAGFFEKQEKKLKKDLKDLQKKEKNIKQKELETVNTLRAITKAFAKAEFSTDGILVHANEYFLKTITCDNLSKIRYKAINSIFYLSNNMTFNMILSELKYINVYKHQVKLINNSNKKLKVQFIPVKDDAENIIKVLFLTEFH